MGHTQKYVSMHKAGDYGGTHLSGIVNIANPDSVLRQSK